MRIQKCCAHCPGKLIRSESNESHNCCQPKSVSGNLRIPSLSRHVSYWPEKDTRNDSPSTKSIPEKQTSCHDQFALAKRLHAENLEHQPLPDRVDDSVFKNLKPTGCYKCISSGKGCDCYNPDGKDSKKLDRRYGSALGCKEPKTKMDLAICWETPVDPVFEPPRASHIDGSEGGLAPAIFSLVQHASNSKTRLRSNTVKSADKKEESCQVSIKSEENSRHSANGNGNQREKNRCCCECLCKNLNGMNVTKDRLLEPTRKGSFRKCVACETKRTKDDPRLIKSAVGLALGLESNRDKESKTVQRSKTPTAKKSSGINTLSPPFSVMHGRRDADFPEHWRLMSVYQQSYKNPYRKRNFCRC